MPSVENRLSTLEADRKNDDARWTRVEDYLKVNYNDTKAIISDMAAIKANQAQFALYQVECDRDRADREKRVTSLENSRKNFYTMGTGIITSITIAANGIIGYFHKG